MTLKGTLNGHPEFALGDGRKLAVSRVVLDRDGYPQSPVIACTLENELIWECEVNGIGADITSEASSSLSVDFALRRWANEFLIFVGEHRIAVIKHATGEQTDSCKLKFTGKDSLDVLQMASSEDSDTLVVASTKTVVGIGITGQILWSTDLNGLLTELKSVGGSEIILKMRDLGDSDLKLVNARFDIRTGTCLD